jgi:PKD repeat protein
MGGKGSSLRVLVAVLVAAALLCWGAAAFADTVFSDDFETALTWTQSGDVLWYTGSPKIGTQGVRLRVTGSIETTISTAGYQGITVSFYMGAYSLDNANENMQALWYDGSTWTVLKQISDGAPEEDNQLHYFEFSLPVGADDNTAFALRFKLNGSGTGDYGYVDNVVVQAAAVVTEPPVAGFSASPTAGLAPLTVGFADQSTHNPTAWYWDFGDGDFSTEQNPSHEYQDPGLYTVSLTATNAYGPDTESKSDYILVVDPDLLVTIFADDFEAGLNWTRSGDVTWYGASPRHGAHSVRLRVTGSIQRTIPTGGFRNITVSFYMGAWSLDSANENVQALWYDGSTWTVLKQINDGDPEENNLLNFFQYVLPASADDNAAFALRFKINGSGTGDYCYVDDVTVMGEVIPRTLALTGTGSGSVRVNGALQSLPWSGQFANGASVTLEAVPDLGWQFASWSGGASGSSNPIVVAMAKDQTINAGFGQLSYTLSLAKVGSGSIKVNGSTVSLPYSGEFLSGTDVTLEAVPQSGWEFGSWSGDANGSSNPVVVTMDGAKSITATFNQFSYTLSLAKVGNGAIKVDGSTVALPYSAEFLSGTDVTVEAVAASGWEFGSWSGDASGSSNPVVVTMDGAKSVTATFNQLSYTLSLAKVGNGAIKVNGSTVALPYSAEFLSGTDVTVEAVVASGWEFSSWSGDVTEGANPVVVTMDGDKSVTATFKQLSYLLTLAKIGSGSAKVDGVTVPLPYSGQFVSGTDVTVEAVARVGWEFGSWSGDASGSSNPIVVTMGANKAITATFNQLSYTLSVAKVGNGSVKVNGSTVSLPYSAQFLSRTDVTLETIAAPGWEFGSWSGDAGGSSNPLTVTMDGARSVTATFDQLSYALSITAVGSGSVKVNDATVALPYSAEFLSGTDVTLEAVPQSGWEFGSWSGDANGSSNPVVVTMDGARSVTATFNQLSYALSITAVGSGSVKVNGATVALPYSAEFLSGTDVTLEAVPQSGWEFGAWSGDASGSSNPLRVTMDGAKSITATFNQLSYALSITAVGSGSVRVNGATVALPYSGEFLSGTDVTLEAVPESGWGAVSWSGDANGTDNPIAITMDGDKSVIASFEHLSYTLSVSAVGTGSVKVNGAAVSLPYSAEFLSGTEVTIEAVATGSEQFVEWTGDATGSENPLTVTMDYDMRITASFMCVEGPFADVPCDFWAVEAIAAARNAGVVEGYADGLYRPRLAVDRAAMAVYLARALTGGDDQIPAPSVAEPTFSDVPAGHWAYRAVEYAVANGIVEGYGDGSYQPKWEVTRGQMAVFVARSIAQPIGEEGLDSYEPPANATFSDVPTSMWCYKHVEYLASEGTVLGYPDGLYRPTTTVTRDQMAVYVTRAFGIVD